MVSEKILQEIDHQVARIFLNNPEKLNALSPGMVEDLLVIMKQLEADDTIRVVILRGSGGNFSSGADLNEIEKLNSAGALRFHRTMNELIEVMTHSSKLFISVLEGYSLGGGFELSLSTDVRFCAEDAVLGQPEIKVGLNAGAGGNAILPRIVGRGNAIYMVLTGDSISARRAYDLGIVQKVVHKERMDTELEEFVTKVLKHPKISVESSKYAINSSMEKSMKEALEIEAQVFSELSENHEVKEKIRKFLNKN